MTSKAFRADSNEVVGDSGSRANETVMNLSKNKKSRKLIYLPNIRAIREPNFLTPNAKKSLNHLRLAFIKALIVQYFDSKSHIWTKTDVSSYVISEVFSQLNQNSTLPPNNLNLNIFDFGQ